MEEIKLKHFEGFDRFFYLICGGKVSGKTSLAKQIIKEKQPDRLVVFTKNEWEWESNVSILSDLEEFVNILTMWKRLNKISPNKKAVFVIDNMKETETLVKSKSFRDIALNSRRFNLTLILTFDPEVYEGDQTNYFRMKPEVRMSVDGLFLCSPIQTQRNDEELYRNYCTDLKSYSNYREVVSVVCRDNILAFTYKGMFWCEKIISKEN